MENPYCFFDLLMDDHPAAGLMLADIYAKHGEKLVRAAGAWIMDDPHPRFYDLPGDNYEASIQAFKRHCATSGLDWAAGPA